MCGAYVSPEPCSSDCGDRVRNESFGKNGQVAGDGSPTVAPVFSASAVSSPGRCERSSTGVCFGRRRGRMFGTCRSAFYRMIATSDILQWIDRQWIECGDAPALVRDGRGGRTAGNGSRGASDRAGIRLRTDRTFWHFGKIVVTSHVLRGVRRTAILSGCGFPGAKSGGATCIPNF